ncbi:MAG: SRPBCC domain-containing protein [Proteobacteria bacterium]|nr:SRPBCC domain-containing protein [Pseudomonadota bacterium]
MIYTESFSVPVDARAVFDALLDEPLLTQWLAEHVRIEPQKGGAYRFWGRDVLWCADEDAGRGEILELDAPRCGRTTRPTPAAGFGGSSWRSTSGRRRPVSFAPCSIPSR